MAVASAADDPEPDPGKTVAEEEDLPPGQREPARRPSSPSTGVDGIIAAVSTHVAIASSHVELDDILPTSTSIQAGKAVVTYIETFVQVVEWVTSLMFKVRSVDGYSLYEKHLPG